MHELAITQDILDIATRYGSENGARKIINIYLVIGNLSSIIDDSVEFYWDIITKNTLAEGSKLHFTRIPVKAKCLDCNKIYFPEYNKLQCPQCGSEKLTIINGEEFYLDAIDIDC